MRPEAKRGLHIAALFAVIGAACVWIYFTQNKTTRQNVELHRHIGEVLAEQRPQHDLGAVVGQVGEVRTPLDPVGSVYVGGELWSARSEAPVAAGAAVRVRGR